MNDIQYNFDRHQFDLDGKAILVTGGTGSFGRAFVRRVLEKYDISRCIVFSRDELKQYEMAQEFPAGPGRPIRYFIGDVRDVERLELAMRGVDFVVHAAALKHVQTAEYNPFEATKTNINGAENVVIAAIRAGVRNVIALSTDKACNPINLYGATKLAADKIFVAGNNLSGAGGCIFSVVRYGNVIGSRGSVVPLFEQLIAKGALELPITDYRMTRFWITLEQGISFVLSCMSLMQGGEIFVPKIPSMKITDLANCMAPQIELKEVGIRAGEKLHEVMISEDDARTTLEFDDRYAILTPFLNPQKVFYRQSGGKSVEGGFRYASDTNTRWLSAEDFKRIIKK
ncbi:MAG: UDP-N-acetylglucosamine 4,6-dehydratase (inverting) [Rhodospirillaceae bacterium]|nr:UDP-N-acetylglucosamine 4,6-dehydratase (inverting) [Rhodospirillaceae bacterium]|tara:strand:- start:1387 stop:2412 length:1026 start_codon:yes stop_codon:yes gene_type:complete